MAGRNAGRADPSAVAALKKAGLEVVVEQAAGVRGRIPDDAYRRRARTVASRAEVFATADILLQVRAMPPDPALRAGQAVIGFADPLGAPQADPGRRGDAA